MSTLWATFGRKSNVNDNVEHLVGPASVSLSGGDVSLSAAPAGTEYVTLTADAACFFNIGAAASTSTHRLNSGERRYFACGAGAVIHGFT